MYSKILIRFGELSTKGKNKMDFVHQLDKNIRRLVGTTTEVSHDRIFIPYSESNIEGLSRVFGIQSFSPVAVAKSTEDDIFNTIMKSIADDNSKTFKVSVNRHWKGYPGTSMELLQIFGGRILKEKAYKVDVKNPELHIEIEIRKEFTYIFVKRIKGLGGYPVGINGNVLHLISGGIDSPVAAWKMMKRGIHVDFVNFITPPHTDELTIDKVNRIVQLLTFYQGGAVLYRNNYTDLMNYIGLVSDQSYKINLMRRSFYRITSKLATERNYLGISNGENIGQVASQTLESMAVIQSQSDFPIYRPLLTSDKLETIEEATKLGTFEISIERAYEACELFAPASPVTKPRKERAEALEKELEELSQFEGENYKNNFERIFFKYEIGSEKPKGIPFDVNNTKYCK